ncbi:hypothetical protein MANES_14G023550v8 [Manihot esculenta]|uniref:Uncharacterized protein n=1 Tax=Manihot esculenta TaxID=3983 RepID=A0ACB7GDI8_MANES|nr:hypothetical protein MANES_14G023550v8 [Manihot esculenta]
MTVTNYTKKLTTITRILQSRREKKTTYPTHGSRMKSFERTFGNCTVSLKIARAGSLIRISGSCFVLMDNSWLMHGEFTYTSRSLTFWSNAGISKPEKFPTLARPQPLKILTSDTPEEKKYIYFYI